MTWTKWREEAGMRKPGPGEAQMYEEMGTTTDVKTCDFCKARGLAETVMLLVHNVDGELAGYMHACDPCGAKAAVRDAQKPHPAHPPNQTPRLRLRQLRSLAHPP